jgi:O-acetyl-ADP-ribose deacetylase (regulator of RNase III)
MATEPDRAPMEVALSRDLLTAKVDALVVSVNLKGVPGAGFAKLAADLYVEWAEDYKRACKDGRLDVGTLSSFDRGAAAQPRFIVALPTKRAPEDGSILEDVLAGIDALPVELDRLGARSVAVPGLGTGLGGLQPDDVFPHFKRAFAGRDIQVLHAFSNVENVQRDLFGQVIEEPTSRIAEASRPQNTWRIWRKTRSYRPDSLTARRCVRRFPAAASGTTTGFRT